MTTNLADVAVEESIQEKLERLEFENQILRSQLAARGKTLEKMSNGNNALLLSLEALNLRQREQLRQHSNALWRRKQTIKKLQTRIEEIFDQVPAAAKWREQRRSQNREDHEWEQGQRRG